MAREIVGAPDWEKLDWQETPYEGVFVNKLEEIINPDNPRVPFSTTMAVKVDPGASIPLHYHLREIEWREKLSFPPFGDFEILKVSGPQSLPGIRNLTIIAGEILGLKNNDFRPLFFTSRMTPGFTGYDEIKEIS